MPQACHALIRTHQHNAQGGSSVGRSRTHKLTPVAYLFTSNAGFCQKVSFKQRSLLCSPLTTLHPWQHDPPLPSKIAIDLSNHTPCKLLSPEGWEILLRNGRVWIVEHNRRVACAQLDAAQEGMLLVRYSNSAEHSIPPAEFLSYLGASCRAQRMADLE